MPHAPCPMTLPLAEGAKRLGIELTPVQVEQFSIYTSLLLEWNQRLNLTRITDPAEIVVKHYLDSLSCLKAGIPKGAKLADVGTGAGFPGIPLAIARPDLRVVLIDATKKRLAFLEAVRDAIACPPELVEGHAEPVGEQARHAEPVEEHASHAERSRSAPDDVSCHAERSRSARIETAHARAEDAGRMPEHRESYDVVVARAVADMRLLVEYCLPLVKVGGKFIAMKGPEVEGEVARAKAGIGTLGGGHPEIIYLTLPGTEIGRSLVVIKKVRATPEQFPRHGSRISAKPLGKIGTDTI